MLKKISALNSKVTASAMAETEDVTLASDDEEQPVASATPCNKSWRQIDMANLKDWYL